MKIIDSHMHLGQVGEYSCNIDTVLSCMNDFKVTMGIISNLSANEFDNQGHLLPDIKTQINVNDEILTVCRNYPNLFRGLFWIKPYSEPYTEQVLKFLLDNGDFFVGLKVHPKGAHMKFTKENYLSYLELCEKLNLPFCIHTEQEGFSNIEYVYEVAKQYPNVKFVMVHMGLGTNHKQAIEYIRELPNIYGDTTLVNINDVITSIRYCGSNKILFGSDAAIFGKSSYDRYKDYFFQLSAHFTRADIDNIFHKNAIKLFRLMEV